MIVCADSGSSTNWYARDVKLRQGMRASLSGTLATMGPAMPYAIAAKFAHPSRPVLAIEGDGAMQMNGNAELLTVAKYWQRWADPDARRARAAQQRPEPGHLGAAGDGGRPEVRGLAGHPRLRLRRATRELCGLQGIRVERPDDIGDAWERAFVVAGPDGDRRARRAPTSRRSRRTSSGSRRRR